MYITILLLVSQHVFGGGLFYDGPSARDFERNNANMAREIHIVQQQFSIDQRQILETMNINMERQRQEITSDMDRYVAEFGRSAGDMANAGRYMADTIEASARLYDESNTANVLRISQTSERCINRLTDAARFIIENIDVQRREIAMKLEEFWISAYLMLAVYFLCSYIGYQSNVSESIVKAVGFIILYKWKSFQKSIKIEDNKEKKIATLELAINIFSSYSSEKNLEFIENGISRINQFAGSWIAGNHRTRLYTVKRSEYIVRNESDKPIWRIAERKNAAGRITHFELRKLGNRQDGLLDWEIEFGAKHMIWKKFGSNEVEISDYMPWAKRQRDEAIENISG